MKTLKMQKLAQRANIAPSSFDAEANTVEVIASTGAKVRRSPFFEEAYIEKLEMSQKAVILDRFNSGAPVLMNHNASDVRDQLGVVESSRIEEGKLISVLRLSTRDEFRDIIKDIQTGIIRNVSVGYVTHEITEQGDLERGMKVHVSTSWEPYELSFVTIPADGRAGTRSSEEEFVCKFIERDDMKKEDVKEQEEVVEERQEDVVETTPEHKFDELEFKRKIEGEQKQRFAEITEACKHADVSSERALEFLSSEKSVDDVRKILLSDLKNQDKEVKAVSLEVGENNQRLGDLKKLESAILNRINPSKNEASDFLGCSLLDLARESVSLKGDSVRGLNATEVATRALHSTSDFPLILQNVMNKELRSAYEEAPATWGAFTRSTTVNDFKEISRVQMGDFSRLLPKEENGEYVAGTTAEAAEKYTMQEYGRSIRIGRRLLINDDLSAFSRMPEMMGRQARNLEADTVIGELASNPLMADGNALFSTAHANLITGATVSVASLKDARKMMRLQKSLGASLLNLRPSWIYAPASLETDVDQIISSITPNTSGQVNPFSQGGRTSLQGFTDARLDAFGADDYYVFAMLSEVDMFEIAYLAGEQAPVTDQMMDFDTDGLKMKIRHTFGVKAIDWRGMVKLEA